jgi:hypothetical protein
MAAIKLRARQICDPPVKSDNVVAGRKEPEKMKAGRQKRREP